MSITFCFTQIIICVQTQIKSTQCVAKKTTPNTKAININPIINAIDAIIDTHAVRADRLSEAGERKIAAALAAIIVTDPPE